MAKIEQQFPYDVYKFILQGIRDADSNKTLERWLGGVQERFEETHSKISDLPNLVLPLETEAEVLQYLKWIVGFSNEAELQWTEGLEEASLRKLILNAVSLWKGKGTRGNILAFLRAFTGRSAILRDWFYHRMIIDETDVLVGGARVSKDPWLYGGRYSLLDENLTYILINRSGVTDNERLLIYELLSYIHPAGANFGIVYCGFVDNFAAGLDMWEDVPCAVPTITPEFSGGRVDLGGANSAGSKIIAPTLPEAEFNTWQRASLGVSIQFTSTSAFDRLTITAAKSADGNKYTFFMKADGAWGLTWGGGVAGGTYTLPALVDGESPPMWMELRIEPVSDGLILLEARFEGVLLVSQPLVGDDIRADIEGGMDIQGFYSSTSPVYVSFCQVLAGPAHLQYVGQASTASTGFVADPDPGPEPFVPMPGEPPSPDYDLFSSGAFSGVLNSMQVGS